MDATFSYKTEITVTTMFCRNQFFVALRDCRASVAGLELLALQIINNKKWRTIVVVEVNETASPGDEGV